MIDWAGFLVVLLIALVAACAIVLLFSLGLRWWGSGRRGARVAGIAMFVLCGLAVLFGVYLVIPSLH